jgi:hypothetical protein
MIYLSFHFCFQRSSSVSCFPCLDTRNWKQKPFPGRFTYEDARECQGNKGAPNHLLFLCCPMVSVSIVVSFGCSKNYLPTGAVGVGPSGRDPKFAFLPCHAEIHSSMLNTRSGSKQPARRHAVSKDPREMFCRTVRRFGFTRQQKQHWARLIRLKIRSREKRGMGSTPIIGTSKKSHFAR